MRLLFLILLTYLISSIAFGQKGSITNKDGKYGLFDENHGLILAPECDTIISKPTSYLHTWNDRFFILKKDNKYAYAYFRNLDSLGNFGYLTPNWKISKFDFDELVVISSKKSLEYVTHLVLRYKRNGKYGLIYIRTHLYCESGLFTFCWINGLGELNKTDAIYDNPFLYNDDKILHVKSEGKYNLLEFVDKDKNWINYTFHGVYDSIAVDPKKENYRFVKKNGKWGLVELNSEKKEIEYLLDCECEHQIKNLSNKLLICEKTDYGKIAVFDIANNKKFEIAAPNINNPLYNYEVISIDTVPNNKQEAHKTYLMLGFGTFDIDNDTYSKGSELYFIDLETQKLKMVYNDTSVNHNFYDGTHGVLVLKKINTQKGFVYEFIDLETEKIAFSLPPEKKEYAYNIMIKSGTEYSCDYLNIGLRYYILKDKDGSTKYGNIGCYCFRTKRYKKGKCPVCY